MRRKQKISYQNHYMGLESRGKAPALKAHIVILTKICKGQDDRGSVISTRSEKSLRKLRLAAYLKQRFLLVPRRNDGCYTKMTI